MAKEITQTPLALRPREAAKALGISPRLLWQLTHDGHIPCVRVGSGKRRTVLYPTADLQAWLSRQAEAEKRRTDDTHRMMREDSAQ
jgi:excisionase family DNA binding protein